MQISKKITVMATMLVLGVLSFDQRPTWANQRAPVILAHHGADVQMPTTVDPVAHIINLADAVCFRLGNDSMGLRTWADNQHWAPVRPTELARHENEFTTLTGGWTAQNKLGVFALVHSKLKAPNDGHVCSLTIRPISADQHLRLKQAFTQQFSTVVSEEIDDPNEHTDRYWLDKAKSPPIKASMIHTRRSNTITIRMIHGRARPLGS